MLAMAVALRGGTFLANPNPRISGPLSAHPPSPCRVSVPALCFRARAVVSADRRSSRLVWTAAYHEDLKHSDIEVEKDDEFVAKAHDSVDAWKQLVESFKEEAIMMKDISAEAYALYSKKALVILKDTSEKLKVQADIAVEELEKLKVQTDIAVEELRKRAKDLGEDGKEYFASSPEPVKEVVEIFSSTDSKDLSQVRDFYVGIPYGALLACGGFLSFMFTGSTTSIRFGLILGAVLFYLSYLSFKSWKRGQSTGAYLKGQTAIMAIIFLRESRLLFQMKSFPTFLMTLISGALLGFYAYRIFHDLGRGSDSEKDFYK